MVGAEVLRESLASLPESQRSELEEVLPIAWVRLSSYNALLVEVARRTGRELLVMDAEAMRRGTERTFSTLWRVLLRFTTDHALIARTPTLYAKGFDTGTLTASVPERGRAVLELTGFPTITDVDLQGVRITIETVLRLAGRREVRGSHQRTPTGGVFTLTFRP